MDIIRSLRESNSRLLKLERVLDIERDSLINDPSNDVNNNNGDLLNNSNYFPYLSMIDKYTGFADEYNKELFIFKDLLQKSVNIKKNNNNNNCQTSLAINNNDNNNGEIKSNYLATTQIVSSPVINNDELYINDNSESNISNTIASSTTPSQSESDNDIDNNNNNINDKQIESNITKQASPSPVVIQEIRPTTEEKSSSTQSSPSPSAPISSISNAVQSINNNNYRNKKIVKAKVLNAMRYKYEGRGFDVWKKNGCRPIYNITDLWCSRTFGNDSSGIAKLKRFLCKRGGFKSQCIENIKISQDEYGDKWALISIRDKKRNILNGIKKINMNKKENIIWQKEENKYRRTIQNKKLYIKNFDILSDRDHRKMTNLFLKFGDLENDIFMNRDRNGNPYAFVTYRDINDSIECERNQNMYYREQSLYFNGKELYIEYVNDNINKNNKNNKNNKKKKNGKFRRR